MYYWHTLASDQGQIVARSHAQLAGAAEGNGGAAKWLSLVVDRSDGSWTVLQRERVIANGVGDAPTVEQAMSMIGASIGSRRGKQPRGSRYGRQGVAR